MKKYLNWAMVYAIVALSFGVFYREYTKFSGFTGITRLSNLHGHYMALGMFFFLFLMILEKLFNFSKQPKVRGFEVLYHVGLNLTGLGFLLRGLMDVAGTELARSVDASTSGIAGLGHTIVGVSLVLLLFKVKKAL